MKKFMTLLLGLVALPLAMTSCDDDNDLPDVDVTVTFDNATKAEDGSMYIVKGNPISVSSIEVTNREAGKKAIATAAIYYLDGVRIGASVVSPLAILRLAITTSTSNLRSLPWTRLLLSAS